MKHDPVVEPRHKKRRVLDALLVIAIILAYVGVCLWLQWPHIGEPEPGIFMN
jgi:hypothetical protein